MLSAPCTLPMSFILYRHNLPEVKEIFYKKGKSSEECRRMGEIQVQLGDGGIDGRGKTAKG
jgi:hypothetical protein